MDGLRGLAALWVLLGHAMILSGYHVKVIGDPDLGVDLFILLSGFLMAHQAQVADGAWKSFSTWMHFWLKRIFRIAPLYYLMLFVSLLFGGAIFHDRSHIDAVLGLGPQSASRYVDSSLKNVLLHASFIFGVLPEYAFRTPLPDWSIGLEMQFYAVFPLIALLASYRGWYFALAASVLTGLIGVALIRMGGVNFPVPSFLPLKMHIFACGMLISAVRQSGEARARFALLIGSALMCLPVGGQFSSLHVLVRLALFLGFFSLVVCESASFIRLLSSALSGRFFYYLGELSFGVYLVHLLVMHRFAYIGHAQIESPMWRFAFVAVASGLVSYLIAAVTLVLVERPGQRMGRFVANRMALRPVGPRLGAR